MKEQSLLIGWAQQDITPDKPINLCGQFNVRISKRVRDPLTVTVLVLASQETSDHVIMVSMDEPMVSDLLRDDIRKQVSRRISAIDPRSIFINATHTHTSHLQHNQAWSTWYPNTDAYATTSEENNAFIASRTVQAIESAWQSRGAGYFGFAIAPAVVGSNRRACYRDGSSAMYGDTSREDFLNVEGDCDHHVNLLYTFDKNKALTGMIINVACPSQVTEGLYEVSADFWHDVREELAKRFGKGVYCLPQCSAAGDQSPHMQITPTIHKRMLKLKYGDIDTPTAWRKEIAYRLVSAAQEVLPLASKELMGQAVLKHECATIGLPFWKLTEEHLKQTDEGIKHWQAELEKLPVNPIDAAYSNAYSHVKYYERVLAFHEQQNTHQAFETEIHIVRLGPIAFATNRFELLLDFGQRIKTRSRAMQTFLVQLTGEGYYLPTERACRGGYGVSPMDGPVGPEGGNHLVEETLTRINGMFEKSLNFYTDRF